MKKVDMSDKAITRRLKQVDQLRELCLSLMRAKKDSDEKKRKEQIDCQKIDAEN
jgi:hypothetical protein